VSEIRTRHSVLLLVAQICGAVLFCQGPAAAQQSVTGAAQQTLTPGSFKAYATEEVEPRVSDFSGLPVPRYSSLRYDKVNGRAGPSSDYPVLWTYERAGLPVVIVRESQDWRKIRDPQGDEVWVRSRLLAGERTAITTNDGALRTRPDAASSAAARYAPGVVLKLLACETAWCRVETAGATGWAPRDHLWGEEDLPAAAP
jgi:SH3-like domain-containing protein